ncbi:COP9 signalosome complex subunit 7b-like [Centroberyx affinis]|uniref:COP9 signalosome complex subunit 7b-like n=1 Tax=Centroberyx affinis TaxID=166261 RepID=UPI003A5C364A
MAGEQKQSSQLEQIMQLAQGAKGSDLISLINQVLGAPGVYAFGEFLELPCVQQLSGGPNRGYFQLLNIFAYGTYHHYQALKDTLPPLNDIQKNKLRHLSIVTLAANMQVIPYSVLMKDLGLVSIRQLEDLLIQAVYVDVIRGKLDQCKQHLEVDFCISRDIPSEGTSRITNRLTQWCSECETVLATIQQQVGRANAIREARLEALQQTETEVRNIRRQLLVSPTTSSEDLGSLGEREEEGAVANPNQRVERRLSPLKVFKSPASQNQ